MKGKLRFKSNTVPAHIGPITRPRLMKALLSLIAAPAEFFHEEWQDWDDRAKAENDHEECKEQNGKVPVFEQAGDYAPREQASDSKVSRLW